MVRTALLTVWLLALTAPAALAYPGEDQGNGWWVPANDKVVTNAGFILIIGFPILVFLLSLAYNRLEQRRLDRLSADKARKAARRSPRRLVIHYERRGAAALVTIDRPERHNAIDGPTAAQLLDAFNRFKADDDAAILVLTGNDNAFCAGADLKAIDTLDADAPGGPLGFTRLQSPRSRRSPRSPATASPAASSSRSGVTSGSPRRRPRSAARSAAGASR